MSTRVRDRKPSQYQFLATMRDLIEHTEKCLLKLPKSARFTKTVPITQMMFGAGMDLNRAASIRIKCEQDFLKRRSLLQNVMGALEGLEFHLSIMFDNGQTYETIGENNWERWGQLIAEERRLVAGLLTADEEKHITKRSEEAAT